MTRYTSIGRKRNYLEAGFSDDKRTTTADDVGNEANESAVEAVGNPPPAKKRKRAKVKQARENNRSEVSARLGGGEDDELVGNAEEKKQVKNAYANRDENRKKEAEWSDRSDQRRLKRMQEKLANTTCFACREKGHAAKDCPKVQAGGASGKNTAKANKTICYRCGSEKHPLSRCRKPENPDNPLPYASCYVCSGKGHIASSCPQNKGRGVYPNGGCCKLCGETSHLARNCPTRKQVQESSTLLVGTGQNAGADEDDFHLLKRMSVEIDLEERKEARMKKKIKKSSAGRETDAVPQSTSIKPSVGAPMTTRKKKVVVF